MGLGDFLACSLETGVAAMRPPPSTPSPRFLNLSPTFFAKPETPLALPKHINPSSFAQVTSLKTPIAR